MVLKKAERRLGKEVSDKNERSRNMNRKILSLVLASALASPTTLLAAQGPFKEYRRHQKEKIQAHYDQQKQENQEFRKELKDMSEEQWHNATVEHTRTQFQENQDFHAKMHEERMKHLREKLSNKKKLNEAKKTEIINFAEEQYQENVRFRQQQNQENVEFLDNLAKNAALSKEQKIEAIKDHMQLQLEENKKFHQNQVEERRTEMRDIRSQMKKKDDI